MNQSTNLKIKFFRNKNQAQAHNTETTRGEIILLIFSGIKIYLKFTPQDFIVGHTS